MMFEFENIALEVDSMDLDLDQINTSLFAEIDSNLLNEITEDLFVSETYHDDILEIQRTLSLEFEHDDALQMEEEVQDQDSVSSPLDIQRPNFPFLRQDKDGDTILHIAIAREDEHTASCIHNAPAGENGIDMINHSGQTALHLAMFTENINCIEALLQRNASIGIFDANGNTALHLACMTNNVEIVDCYFRNRAIFHLMYEAVIDAVNNEGLAALHIAANNKNKRILDMLLQNGANVNAQDGHSGKTILIFALESALGESKSVAQKAISFATEIVQEFGADINITSHALYSPLHYACLLNSKEMVNLLLQHDPNVGEKTFDRKTEKDLTTDDFIKKILDRRLRKKRKLRLSESSTT